MTYPQTPPREPGPAVPAPPPVARGSAVPPPVARGSAVPPPAVPQSGSAVPPHAVPPQPPRQQHAVPPPPPVGGTARRGGFGKVLLVSLVVGGLVAALVGTGGYFVTRTLTGGDGAVRCGDGDLCFAHIDPALVASALEQRGYVCYRTSGGRECTLVTGSARYQVALVLRYDGRDWVHRYEASAEHSPEVAMPERGDEFLAWFAALPFGDDTQAAAEVQQWLAANRADQGDHTTNAGGFEYTLAHRQGSDQRVALVVDAGTTWR